ncbi:Starch-binding associating with outer membrane [Reichenbachiella agariperforans]|uniref:Starch-binding associating with outer membrane n=2 Tax=Reichenbachiellaceae TaxID=2762302 RepID=A0A1M6K352_REIAG|nr:Starch-binding associating with outer membrane [Reichenbachiella agariperforans]
MLVSLLIVSSCSDSFIEVEPRGTELEDNYYRNAEEALAGLVAVYDQVGGMSNGLINKFIATNSASDDHYAGGGSANDVTGIQVWSNYTLDPATGPQGDLWNRGYSGIFRANSILGHLPDVDMDDNLRARYVAEAKFLRAYFYFDLVRFFENIPLIISSDLGDFKNIPQVDPSEVYTQVIEDLIAAIPDLPATVPVATEGGRATEGAARALLGKVYLWQEDFAKAAEQFAEVNGTPGGTSQFGYSLLPNFGDLWIFSNKHHSESIFSVNHTSEGQWGDWGCIACAEGNWLNIMINPRGYTAIDASAPDYVSGWSFNPVTPSLEAAMTGDPRYSETIADLQTMEDNGLVTYEKGYQNTGFFIEKFTSRQENVATGGNMEGNFEQNLYDIRLADTYLLEAEALVRDGSNTARAQALLDAVRARVGLASTPATFETIKAERRLELAGEGHRWFDLVRWGDAATVLASRGFVAGKHEILPIPLFETQDTAIEQNLEYGGTK